METLNGSLPDAGIISTENGSSELLSLLVIGGLSSLSIGITKVFVPLFALALSADEFQLGMASAAMAIGTLLMSIPAGKITSYINVKYVFSTGLFIGLFVYLSFFYIKNAWFFVVALILLSATFAFRFIPLQKKFLSLMKKLSSASAGWLRATQMLGIFVIGPTLAGLYLNVGSLHDLPWLIMGILVVCIVLCLTTSGLNMPPIKAAEGKNGITKSPICVAKSSMRLNSAYGIEMAVSSTMNIFNAFCVLLATSHYGLDAKDGAVLIVWQGAGFALSLLFGGALVARFNAQKTQWLCLAITTFSLLLLTITWQLWQAKVLSIVIGVSMAALSMVNMHTYSELSVDERSSSKIATMSVFMAPLGGVVGTILAGLTAHFFNVNAVYYLSAIFITIAAVFMYFLTLQFRYFEVKHG